MDLGDSRAVVTGGGGFVGSHLAERLLEADATVSVVDDLSNGRAEWVPEAASFLEGDLTEMRTVERAIDEDTDVVFHLAARKNVDDPNPRSQFEENTTMTMNVLERMAEVGVSNLVFTSSSTVYGEAPRPTPEDYPPFPISTYGAAKTAEEALISASVHDSALSAWVFRFANVVGPRLQAGAVIVDFIDKLLADPTELTIKGNGRQEKSYLWIEDCLDGMLSVVSSTDSGHHVFNLGTRTTTSVLRIADVVSEVMGLDPSYTFTGGERGWSGDVPRMRLSIEKLQPMGWEPRHASDEAVRMAATALYERRRGGESNI
ncbi:MAG: NAD-dependent epimerase/dehydratase family protein [Halodesulfurarchaeum sp.]